LLIGALLLLALLAGLIYATFRRRRAAWWRTAAHRAASADAAADRTLAAPPQPVAGAEAIWLAAREDAGRRLLALDLPVRELMDRASGARERRLTEALVAAIAALTDAVGTDDRMQLASPPPTAEQRGLSQAIVGRRASQLKDAAAAFLPDPAGDELR
jgi:hypothetical protein